MFSNKPFSGNTIVEAILEVNLGFNNLHAELFWKNTTTYNRVPL